MIVETYTDYLNTSKILIGCLMLLMNIGGRYISKEIPATVENMLDRSSIRLLIVFSIIFVATRDVKISLLLTLMFILLTRYLLHEKSKFCLVKGDDDPRISTAEATQAYGILKKYKEQKIEEQKDKIPDPKATATIPAQVPAQVPVSAPKPYIL